MESETAFNIPGARPPTYLILLLLLGALIRIPLFPLPFNQDFADYIIDAQNVASGGNLYNNPLPSGSQFTLDGILYTYYPFAKPPLFIYMMVAAGYVSAFTGVPIAFLGKAIILLGDLGVSYLIYSFLMSIKMRERDCLSATCLYLLNPFVIFVSAISGKFDSIPLFFLMLALRNAENLKMPLYYGLSFATKQFTLFMLPWFLFKRLRNVKYILGSIMVFLIVLLPGIIHGCGDLGDLLFAHTDKTPRGFSWMIIFGGLPYDQIHVTTSAIFSLYILFLILLAALVQITAYAYAALAFSSMIIFSAVVWEQYLTWSIPFLSITYVSDKSRASLLLLAAYSIAGLAVDPVNATNRAALLAVNIILLLLTSCFVAYSLLRASRKN
jgi:hypothetical protein